MSKQVKPAAKPAPKARKARGPVYQPGQRIVVVTGDDARRVVRNLSVDRAMQAIIAHDTVGKFVTEFGKLCDKQPLPGRSGQPGQTQAAAILRFLDREGAVKVQ